MKNNHQKVYQSIFTDSNLIKGCHINSGVEEHGVHKGVHMVQVSPSFFGERTNRFSQIFHSFDLYDIVHSKFLVPCAIPVYAIYEWSRSINLLATMDPVFLKKTDVTLSNIVMTIQMK